MESANASITASSAVPGWSRSKIERTNLRSIGRRFLARNSGSRLLRSASVGEPSPVHTIASSASRATMSGWRCANKAGRNPVDQKRALTAHLFDIARGREAIVGAVGDGRVVVAGLGGAAVALHVDTPGVVAAPREEIHRRGIGAPRYLQVEGRLRSHGRAVHEQDSAGGARGIAGVPVPQEQADVAALVGPVFFAADNGGG